MKNEIKCIARKDIEISPSEPDILQGSKGEIMLNNAEGKRIVFDVNINWNDGKNTNFVQVNFEDGRKISCSTYNFKEHFELTYLRSVEVIEPEALGYWTSCLDQSKVGTIQFSTKNIEKWKVWRIYSDGLKKKYRIVSPLSKELIKLLWHRGYEITVLSRSTMATIHLSLEMDFYVESWYAYNGTGLLEKIRALDA